MFQILAEGLVVGLKAEGVVEAALYMTEMVLVAVAEVAEDRQRGKEAREAMVKAMEGHLKVERVADK